MKNWKNFETLTLTSFKTEVTFRYNVQSTSKIDNVAKTYLSNQCHEYT